MLGMPFQFTCLHQRFRLNFKKEVLISEVKEDFGRPHQTDDPGLLIPQGEIETVIGNCGQGRGQEAQPECSPSLEKTERVVRKRYNPHHDNPGDAETHVDQNWIQLPQHSYEDDGPA